MSTEKTEIDKCLMAFKEKIDERRKSFGENTIPREVTFRELFKGLFSNLDKSAISRYRKGELPKGLFDGKEQTEISDILEENIISIYNKWMEKDPECLKNVREQIENDLYHEKKIIKIIDSYRNKTKLKGTTEELSVIITQALYLYKKNPTVRELKKELNYQPKEYEWFFGREKELNDMRSILNKKRCVIVYGINGIGKTSLCLHYLSLNRYRYKQISKLNFISNLSNTISPVAHSKPSVFINDSVIFIDKFDVEIHKMKKFDICEYIKDYPKCQFIFASSLNFGMSENENTKECCIGLSEMTDNVLDNIFLKNIKSDSIRMELEPEKNIIYDILHRHTLSLSICADLINKDKEFSVQYFIDSLSNKRELTRGVCYIRYNTDKTKRTFVGHIDKLFDLNKLNDSQIAALWLISCTLKDYTQKQPVFDYLSIVVAEKLLEDVAVLDDLIIAGYLSKTKSGKIDRYYIHPLVADVVRRNINAPSYEIDKIIKKINCLLSDPDIIYDDDYEYDYNTFLKAIFTIYEFDSDIWYEVLSNVLRYYCLRGSINTAIEIYAKTKHKKHLSPEYKIWLSKAQKKEQYFSENPIIDVPDPIKSYTLSKINTDQRLFNIRINIDYSIESFKEYLFPIKKTLGSYTSKELFLKPVDIDFHSLIPFLLRQLSFDNIEDTDIYKNIPQIITEETFLPPFFNQTFYFKIQVTRICLLLSMEEFYSGYFNYETALRYFNLYKELKQHLPTHERVFYLNRFKIMLDELGDMHVSSDDIYEEVRLLMDKDSKNGRYELSDD